MKNLLFPNIFQPIGWFLFIPSLILGMLILVGILSFSGVAGVVLCDAAIIGTVIGAIFIVCSKEKTEDEMTKSIRLSSLLNSIYIYAALLIVCTIGINGILYIHFAFANLALLPIIFVCIFRLEMHRYNKISGDEE